MIKRKIKEFNLFEGEDKDEVEDSLLNTIYIPKNLVHLKDRLPAASYVDSMAPTSDAGSRSMILPKRKMNLNKVASAGPTQMVSPVIAKPKRKQDIEEII